MRELGQVDYSVVCQFGKLAHSLYEVKMGQVGSRGDDFLSGLQVDSYQVVD